MLFESIARTGFALAVALGIAEGQSAFALGHRRRPAAQPARRPVRVPARARPQARRRTRERALPTPSERARTGDAVAGEFTLAHGSGFAAAVLLIMLSEQTFLNAGPLLVRATEGAAAAGFIFNVLMIARAPLQLFQAVATSLLPHLTRLASRSDGRASRARRSGSRSG